MHNQKLEILSTKVLDANLVTKAASLNVRITCIPFIHTQPILSSVVRERIATAILQPTTVIFTSENAIAAVIACLDGKNPEWEICCTAPATEEAARKLLPRCTIVHTANNAAVLAKAIAAKPIKRLIFFCGDLRKEVLPELLKQNGIELEEVVVYRTISTPTTIEKEYDAICFFSPSAVQSFFSSNSVPSSTVLFAIGASTEAEIRIHSTNLIVVADRPDVTLFINKIISEFPNRTPDQNKKEQKNL